MTSASTHKNEDLISLARTLDHVPTCEEYDRMISGMLYNPNVSKLLEARHRCRGVSQDYNNLDTKKVSSDQIFDERRKMLRQIVGKVGDGTFVEPPFRPDYGCNTIIGKDCFINFNLTILDTSLVIIGDRVQIAPNVSIFSASHETSVLSRIKFVEFGHPVFIEDDCWIGGNVVILPGVRIGRGSTIAAGSVVTKDIPPYSIGMGAPCKVRKTIPSVEEEMNDPSNPYKDMVREA